MAGGNRIANTKRGTLKDEAAITNAVSEVASPTPIIWYGLFHLK